MVLVTSLMLKPPWMVHRFSKYASMRIRSLFGTEKCMLNAFIVLAWFLKMSWTWSKLWMSAATLPNTNAFMRAPLIIMRFEKLRSMLVYAMMVLEPGRMHERAKLNDRLYCVDMSASVTLCTTVHLWPVHSLPSSKLLASTSSARKNHMHANQCTHVTYVIISFTMRRALAAASWSSLRSRRPRRNSLTVRSSPNAALWLEASPPTTARPSASNGMVAMRSTANQPLRYCLAMSVGSCT
mmetsp:Transcript_26174/g.89532  ORF Transcript_26174/g.89532 Transcript_26174/m.89532 type:complete len:239 (-) Transcript_26174:496-1212(-)